MSARELSNNQVVTRSNIRNLDSNKPITRKIFPEQRSTTDKNLSWPSSVPRKGSLKKNGHPLRMPSQKTKKVVSPDFAKPQHKETMQRKQANLPGKAVPPAIQGSLNTNILGKIYGSSIMMSLKELITIHSIRD